MTEIPFVTMTELIYLFLFVEWTLAVFYGGFKLGEWATIKDIEEYTEWEL